MWNANKGEWSEAYVFLRLLADGEIFAADADLKKLPDVYYPIVSIERNDHENYRRDFIVTGRTVEVVDPQSGIQHFSISRQELSDKADILLKAIRNATTGVFAVEEIEDYLLSIGVESIKSKSINKRDLTIVAQDYRTGITPKLGFSIKSKLGSASTLLNASKKTNFVFELEGGNLSAEEIFTINEISNGGFIGNRLERIRKRGIELRYVGNDSQIFKRNLQMIDSLLPELIAYTLKNYYQGRGSKVRELTEFVAVNDPLAFGRYNLLEGAFSLYAYKFKNFLTDVALGMVPSENWTGRYDATGGYLIVRDDGHIRCYHIYNRSEFQTYLFENTKLETASTRRHKFGKIFVENGISMLKLNLQIRFL